MNTSKIPFYIQQGAGDKNWYADTRLLFIELFGIERLHLVTQLFAATSINSSLKSNIRLFRRALYEIENNKPLGNYLPVMRLQLEAIRLGKEMSGRKIRSFAAAMFGDPNAVVVDIWLLRAFEVNNRYYRQRSKTVREGGATDLQYTIIESYVRHEAMLRNLEPRQISAMIWSGIRGGVTRYDLILKHQIYNMYENQD